MPTPTIQRRIFKTTVVPEGRENHSLIQFNKTTPNTGKRSDTTIVTINPIVKRMDKPLTLINERCSFTS